MDKHPNVHTYTQLIVRHDFVLLSIGSKALGLADLSRQFLSVPVPTNRSSFADVKD